MSKQAGKSSLFSYQGFVHQHPFRHLLIAGIAVTTCLTATVLLAQQRNPSPHSEPKNIIKLRQEWFYQQRAYPHKHIPPGARLKAINQLRKMRAAQQSRIRRLKQQTSGTPSTAAATSSTTLATTLATTSWNLIGPQPTTTPFAFNPVSGRVTALAVDPTNPNTVYLGGAEGGVWKTTDGGQTWTPLTDNQPSLAVGSIAIDPENPQTIYVGTGEENFNQDAYFGAGILKSTDGGSTWTPIGAGPQDGPYGPDPYFYGGYVGSLAVDPQNSQVLLAAVNEVSNLWGIYRSTDGGQDWTQVQTGLATQVFFDPKNGSVAYAVFAGSGVYKSVNSGANWTTDNGTGTNVLNTNNSFKISVAMDPQNTSTLYASVTSQPDSSGNSTVLGFYKTTDGGANWTAMWTPATGTSSTFPSTYCDPSGAPGQCWYDSVLAVDPASSSIFIGGSFEGSSGPGVGALWRSEDGGTTWTDVDPPQTASGVQALHPDLHAIAFAADGSKMYVGTDGGVWSTTDVTTSPVTWTNLNTPLSLTQFYPGMSVAAFNNNFTLGGTQDNGTQYYSGSLAWQMIVCGDGAETAIDPSGSGIVYAGCGYAPGSNNQDFLLKYTPSGGWAPADSGIDGNDPGEFIPPLAIDPSNPQTLYFGTDRVYQTTDGGADWTAISGSLSYSYNGPLTAIAVATSDSNTVYAASDDGYIAATFNASAGAGANWQLIGGTAGLPLRYVTALAVDPQNAKNVFATLSGYCESGMPTCPSGSGHVFEFTAASGVWSDLSGNLPDTPVSDIVVDPDIPNTLYVATDVGVFVGTNSGSGWQWAPLGTGLPNVVVSSLKLQHATRVLIAASHGRSAWQIQLPAPAGPNAAFSVPNLTFPPQQVGTTSAAKTIIVTNNGSATLNITSITASGDFAETNTCGSSLSTGSNCTISVTFTPVTLGTQTGTVTITDNASGSPQTVGLYGKGFSGAVSLSPTSLAFGNQPVGTTSSAQTVTLTNSSTVPLTIVGVASSSHFTATTDCPLQPNALAGGATCHINVTFAPTAMGTFVEQLTLTDSAGDSPQTIPVTGTGIQAVVSFNPSSLTFSPQVVGTTATQTATLTNTGTANLTIDGVSAVANTAQDSSIVNTPNVLTESDNCPRSPSTIPPQGSCTINVTFNAPTWGNASGSVEVTDNALYNTQYLSFSGTAYSGTAKFSSDSLHLGNVTIGKTSQPQPVTLTNSGGAPLYISNIIIGPEFNETNDCPISPSTLSGGKSCTVNVTFTPNSGGTVDAGLTFFDSSSGGFVQSLTMYGTSVADFALAVESGTSSSATVSPGGAADYSLAVTPEGGFNQGVSLACSGAPAHSTCTVSPSSVTLNGTSAQDVKVTVTTAAPGLLPPGPNSGPPASGGFALHDWWVVLLMLMAGLAAAFKRRRRVTLLAGAVLLAAMAMGCGGGAAGSGSSSSSSTGTSSGTPAGTYTLTVTGTSGSLSHQATLKMTVQ